MCVALASLPLIERLFSSGRLFKSSPHSFSTNCISSEAVITGYQVKQYESAIVYL